jgi:hypothetical protein
MTQKANNGTELLVEKFSQFEAASRAAEMAAAAAQGRHRQFRRPGFSKLHDEDWRFTNVAPIAKLPFQLAREVCRQRRGNKLIDESAFAKLPGHRLVFVNGFFSRETFQHQAGFRRRAD